MIDYHKLMSLKEDVLQHLHVLDESAVIAAIEASLSACEGMSFQQKNDAHHYLINAILNYDVLQPLLDSSDVSEIMVNGPHSIFVEMHGRIEPSDVTFYDQHHLSQLIHKIATEVGREVNVSTPIMDARLKDGSRVNVILDPIARNGPILTIRKFKQTFHSLRELVACDMLTPACAAFLEKAMQYKYNFFICGGTGSGKTTLLNCLSGAILDKERVVIIEDASEIQVKHLKNIIFLETRQGQHHQNPISMSTLIKNALRMRPDRIIVGEVRGEEVTDMLQAMSTGHDGSVSTGHSNSAKDMLTRLEVIASSHSPIPNDLIRRQIISAIDILVYVERLHTGKRCVTEISELIKSKADYCLNTLYAQQDGVSFSTAPLEEKLIQKDKWRKYDQSI